MPIYEYICTQCSAPFELLIRNERETPRCPSCGSKELSKEFSVPAAHSPSAQMPVMGPGNCGRPQCGGGRCAGLE
jgi:putative FmdB family regulatory protein